MFSIEMVGRLEGRLSYAVYIVYSRLFIGMRERDVYFLGGGFIEATFRL